MRGLGAEQEVLQALLNVKMAILNFITGILSILTLIGDILIIFLIYEIIIKKDFENNFLNKKALLFAFVISLIATFGSLFYSEIAGYIPCELCWYQRIFMYPLPILLGIALFKKDNKISHYVIPLSIIGGIVSIYHYITQILNNSVICSAESAACASTIFFSYGYITIPIMALTAFTLIIFLTYFANRSERRFKDE